MTALLDKISEKSRGGEIAWESFINSCLYDADFGYYRAARERTGGRGDFYTSASLKGKVFSLLIEAAAKKILADAGIEEFEFVEIGAEPNARTTENSRVFRLDDKIEIPETSAVFSNELLDARPFARFKFEAGSWRKGFVVIEKPAGKFRMSEIFKIADETETEFLLKYFPKARVNGFRLDVSFDALELFGSICAQQWRGALIFADYFRSSEELSLLPNGTARAYMAHKDFADISAFAGDADITFSPCSDMLEDIAARNGFLKIRTQTQESFFVENAAKVSEKIISSPDPLDPRKRELVQLLNPVHMGAVFRVFSAVRT